MFEFIEYFELFEYLKYCEDLESLVMDVSFECNQCSQHIETFVYVPDPNFMAEKNKDSLNFYQKKYNEILSSIYKSETLKASQEIEVKYQTEKKERQLLKNEFI